MHENLFIGHLHSLLCPKHRRPLAGRYQPGAAETQAIAGARLTTIMGTVQEDGDKLRFVTDQRAWNVDNPETLNGHEGHYVHAEAYVYPDKDSIHIVEVKMPTASETEKDDTK